MHGQEREAPPAGGPEAHDCPWMVETGEGRTPRPEGSQLECATGLSGYLLRLPELPPAESPET